MGRRHGYSLLELGIVLGVAIIILTAIAATMKGANGAARAQRTGDELFSISRAAAAALKRNLVADPVNPGVFRFRPTGAAASVFFSNTAPLCYDLSRAPNSTPLCPTSGAAGAPWSNLAYYPTVSPVPAGSPLLAVLGGGTTVYGNGYNAWCEPFVVCLYPSRAEVLTCVPVDDVGSAGLAGTVACGACTEPSPVTGEPTRCILTSTAVFHRESAQFKYSYAADDPSTLQVLPPAFTDHPMRP